MITINYLKDLFKEKYGRSLFDKDELPEILVTLTKDQYNELNNDLISMTGHGILLLVDELESELMAPEDILYTKIHVPNLCDFLVQLGDNFEFKMSDEEKEYGEEDL